jgi:hypothetical protein
MGQELGPPTLVAGGNSAGATSPGGRGTARRREGA